MLGYVSDLWWLSCVHWGCCFLKLSPRGRASPGEGALSQNLTGTNEDTPTELHLLRANFKILPTESFLRIAPALLLGNTCLFTCSKEQRDDTQLIGQLANSGPDNFQGEICLPIRKRRGGTGQADLRRWTASQCDLPSILSVAKITLMCSRLQANVSCPIL